MNQIISDTFWHVMIPLIRYYFDMICYDIIEIITDKIWIPVDFRVTSSSM